jgi:phosphoribosylamine--glycine ligase
VIEYNARFGDPETEAVLPRLQNDLVEVFEKVIKDDELNLSWDNEASDCVILASKGYPDKYEKGVKIEGLDMISEDVVCNGK